jgi:rubrerythrin
MTWQQLKDIIDESKKEEVTKGKITECPECGFMLRENEHGDLLCPICGWSGNK